MDGEGDRERMGEREGERERGGEEMHTSRARDPIVILSKMEDR